MQECLHVTLANIETWFCINFFVGVKVIKARFVVVISYM